MTSLADIPELVGFFSYSREDDQDSQGALSALRARIQGELRGQLGRTAKTFRLWQDREAIASGTLWESEIKNAVGQAVFFIPIITPTVVASPYCRFELEAFLTREAALGRGDLVFPILYIDVPALDDPARRQNDPVLSLIARRQYVDWSEFRYLDVNSTEVRRAIGRFCVDIRNSLHRPWISPEERSRKTQAAVIAEEEAESQHREAEVKPRAEEAVRQTTADEQRRQHEAEVGRTRGESERQIAEANRPAETEEYRNAASPLLGRQKSRPILIFGSIAGVVVVAAIGAWLAMQATQAPVPPPPPAPVTFAPPPVTPPTAAVTPIPGLDVSLGNTIDQVRDTYNLRGDLQHDCASDTPCLMLNASLTGLTFLFHNDNKLLYQIAANPPFSGSVEGVRIGDPLPGLLNRFGQPGVPPWDFGDDKAYIFYLRDLTLRCDIDKAGNVARIFVWTK